MNSVIIVAAGNSSRMKTKTKKPYILLNNKEILAHTIDKFENNINIDEIIVVVCKEDKDYCYMNIIKKYGYNKVRELVIGGKERQDSVYNGLLSVDKDSDIVLIHDSARPFISDSIINNSIDKVNECGTAIVGVRCKDTIKTVYGEYVDSTLDRNILYSIQTPQTFRYDIVIKAYEEAKKTKYYSTDDSALVENIGYKVKIIDGDYRNIKITTMEDLLIAKAFSEV